MAVGRVLNCVADDAPAHAGLCDSSAEVVVRHDLYDRMRMVRIIASVLLLALLDALYDHTLDFAPFIPHPVNDFRNLQPASKEGGKGKSR